MKYARNVLIIVLALVFSASGLAKFISPGVFEDRFAQFGLPHWFVPLTGAVELLGASLIAFFRDARRQYGAAMLAVTMAVATGLHLAHDPLAMALPAFALMLLAGSVALVPSRKIREEGLGST